ncbi:RDD family protein [Neolewinella aurantiaca]|uniref:RDD family protein n=1 Tax=Neolewinella aurantiaca TaxID=2602767 RepID=UPI00164EEA16|nr:RDD family protein [Neolewinella aurantiaca]
MQNTPHINPETGSPDPAPLQRRFIAWLLDRAVLLPLTGGLLYSIIELKSLPFAILMLLVEAIYKPIMEGLYGQTLGKKWMNILVVNQKGFGPISWNQSLLRYLPWAAVFYATVFIIVRHFQADGFMEVDSWPAYIEFGRKHPLGENLIIAMINYLPLFSVMWVISDPMKRALHDRVAGTVVLKSLESA